jgi:uncharacterized RDD family membrane protein YckC
MSELVTGEAVQLELREAKLASRGLAFALDVLLQFLALFITFLILTASGFVWFDKALSSAIVLLVVVAILIGYPVLSETLSHGQTVGKAAAGLRVVRDDGGPIRFRHALVRGLAGFFVDFWGVGFFGAVAVTVSFCSKNSKRVGDLLAGTVVIRIRVPPQRAGAVAMPPPLAGWASEVHVGALSSDLALAIRQYLSRVHEMNPEAAAFLGQRLAADVSAQIGAPVPPGVPVYAYLAAVLAERRTREHNRLAGQPFAQPFAPAPVVDTTKDTLPDGPFAPPS